MRKSWFVCLCLGMVVLAPASAQEQAQAPAQEPMHEGKSLSQWLTAMRLPDVATRQKAAQAVATIGWQAPNDPTTTALGMLSDNRDVYNRLLAAYVLTHVRPDAAKVTKPLVDALKDKNATVGRQAAEALVRLPVDAGPSIQQQVVALLLAERESKEFWSRLWAVYVLGAINGDPKVVAPVLTQVYKNDKAEEVRKMAADSLKRVDPDAAKAAGIP